MIKNHVHRWISMTVQLFNIFRIELEINKLILKHFFHLARRMYHKISKVSPPPFPLIYVNFVFFEKSAIYRSSFLNFNTFNSSVFIVFFKKYFVPIAVK